MRLDANFNECSGTLAPQLPTQERLLMSCGPTQIACDLIAEAEAVEKNGRHALSLLLLLSSLLAVKTKKKARYNLKQVKALLLVEN